MWSVLKVPTMWWIIASGALLNFNMYAYGTFLVSLFVRTHKETLATAGLIVGAIYAIGGLAGGFAGGTLGDLVVRRQRNGRMLAASCIALAGMPLAYLGIQQPNGSWLLAAVLLTLAYAACNSYYGLVYASIQDIVPPTLRGSAMSLYFLFMYMCGAALGPLLTGQLSDWRARLAAERLGSLGPEARAIGLQEAMLVIPVLSLLLAGVLWAGSRTIARDIDRRSALVTTGAAA